MRLKWLVSFGCLCLFFGSLQGTEATPFISEPTFTEMGNDVKVTLVLKDIAVNARDNLPLCFKVELWESDILFDDFLGEFCFKVTTANSTQTLSNGWDTGMIMYTYKNASNAATGLGNDYILKLTQIDCDDCDEIPEPATLLILGASMPAVLRRRKRLA